ncbi:hypothetical protein CL630_00865 [bacterium]|nr:hypothetical protein [bacterium]|tara:strand:- start:25241 stop:25597 length:357 start_codon:yes stop_codon:yes gene_type:complete
MNKNEESPWGNVNESQRKVAEEGKREEAKKQADETIFVDKKGEARKKEKDRKPNEESPWRHGDEAERKVKEGYKAEAKERRIEEERKTAEKEKRKKEEQVAKTIFVDSSGVAHKKMED